MGQGAGLAAAVREVVRRRTAQRRRITASTATATGPDQEQGGHRSGKASPATAGCCAIKTSSARSRKFANVLKGLGVRKGDVVAVYMPLVPELVIALLACAGIGAPHTVIFGGFSAESLAGRIQDCKAKVLVTADGGYRRGKLVPLKENADAAAALCPTPRARGRLPADRHARSTGRPAATTGGTSWRSTPRPTVPPSRSTASIRCTSSTPRARPANPRASSTPPAATCLGTTLTTQVGLRPQGRRHLLVHGRRRLGDGPLLPGLRPAVQRRHLRDVRGGTQLARRGPVLEDHRGLPGHDPLHGPDGDPGVHEVGRAVPPPPRPVEPAPAGHGRRADQSRGLDVVSQGHRRRTLPDRRHLVADRNRRDHDLAAARRHAHGARLGDPTAARHRPRDRHQGRPVLSAPTRAASSSSSSPGRRCCARSTATTSATRPSTGATSPAATSPATAPGATRTATTGSWAGSTTCSTSPATGSRRWRSRAPWSATRSWPRPPWWASPTT